MSRVGVGYGTDAPGSGMHHTHTQTTTGKYNERIYLPSEKVGLLLAGLLDSDSDRSGLPHL